MSVRNGKAKESGGKESVLIENSSDKVDEKKQTLFARYNSLMSEYPLMMNCSQAAIITSLGVITSQFTSSYLSNHI